MNASVVPGLVSIVVASYNHAEFLEQRMESLIEQTYQDIEILVIDDCSSDDSVEVLAKYQSHPKVNLIVRETNGGWVTVSNQGIEMSSGEFVIFANCDDSCDLNMVQRLVDAMERYPTAGISFCRSLFVNEEDQVIGNDFDTRERSFRRRCASDTLLKKEEMSRFLLHSCVIPNLSAALFRKECFVFVGNLSSFYRVCCDWDLFFRVVTEYDVAYIAAPLNRFRQHNTSIVNITNKRVIHEEYIRILLGQIRILKLNWIERCYYRTHVMYLWSVHLVSPSLSGLRHFPYHLKQVWRLDPQSLTFLSVGLILRSLELCRKSARRLKISCLRRLS